MKKLFIVVIIISLASSTLLAQSSVIQCPSFTLVVNKDSLDKTQTVFQTGNFNFLRGATTDSTYKKSKVYNKQTFNSTMIVVDDKKIVQRKK